MKYSRLYARAFFAASLIPLTPLLHAEIGQGESSIGLLETVSPATGSLSVAGAASSSPILIEYSGVTDIGSGLEQVELWYRTATSPWSASGVVATNGMGVLEFAPPGTPPANFGEYFLQLVALDQFGNSSTVPSGTTGTGQASVTFESTSSVGNMWMLE